jgi:hypothetical protein
MFTCSPTSSTSRPSPTRNRGSARHDENYTDTFRPSAEVSKRKIERWPDHRHHPDDGRRNPFGLWRFLEPGDPGLTASNPVPVLVPSLVSQLLAAERAKGQPLTRSEVESVLNDSPAMAMAPADAAKLERSRGYADIEPELAWEQWQLVRERR